jgi:hypothetical protein
VPCPRLLLLTLTMVSLSGCLWGVRPVANSHELNADNFIVIREGIDRYVAAHGVLPDSLIQICPSLDGADCHWLPFGYRLLDAWKAPILYTRVGDEYELRSAGPDHHPHTADDVVFRPSLERGLVLRTAGCYRISDGWWSDFRAEEVRLDTVSLGRWSYHASPVVPNYRPPTWEVIGVDSIAIAWREIHHSVQLRLHVREGELIGYSAIGGGFASWGPRRHVRTTVTAIRIDCGVERPAA